MAILARLQPKQARVLDWLYTDRASWIGAGGGRGAAKSGGADRIALHLAFDQPGIVMCIVMRNFDQVRKYHVEPVLRTYPDLRDYFTISTSKLKLPTGSEIDFSYAENLADVERRFRSANYKYIIVDQAEQFSEEELREMKNACRWPGGGAKILLLFNMGGAGCIQTLRRWFHDKDFTENEDPRDYKFLHFYPWDNVEWARDALALDGLTEEDYYGWSDRERFEYFTTLTDYGRNLNSLPDALRNRDLLSSWDSLEGAFFGRAFDRQATLVDNTQVTQLLRDWDTRWMSLDWGKSHFCVTLWHGMRTLAPSEALSVLGWSVTQPLRVVVTYRRLIVNELTSPEVGKRIVASTPVEERKRIKQFFAGHDAFGERDSPNTIAMNIGKELRPYELPGLSKADIERPGGWGLMYDMLFNTKMRGLAGDTCWLISAECPELLDSIPMLMRDPKDLDVVLKTDKGSAKLEQDVSETARYGLKSMLSQAKKPHEVVVQEQLAAAPDGFARHLILLNETERRNRASAPKPYWE
jgi:hypothetical protein